MRAGKVRIEFFRFEKFGQRTLLVTGGLVDGREVVMRNRIRRNQTDHLFEFSDRLVEVARVFVDNAQIEPGMRNGGVLLLCFEQLRTPLLCLTSAKEREAIVHAINGGIGSEIKRLLLFFRSLDVRVGIFIKGFAKVSMFPELLLDAGATRLHGDQDARGRKYADKCKTSHLG